MDSSLGVAAPDLRTYLDTLESATLRLRDPVSTVHDLTALQYALQEAGRFPVIVAEQPRLADGTLSALPVVTNLSASRELTARALGIEDHRTFARQYADLTRAPVAPTQVPRQDAPVQEVVQTGDEIDLTRLPALTQHVGDPGPYLTAAHAVTYDPDSGIDNVAIQRCWIRDRAVMSYFPYPASHNARNMRKFWQRGEDCPIAFWIGHHPLVLMGAQAKLDYPESHWGAVGGVLGAPLRVVPSLTHGARILVPAEAEIVIEGWVPKETFGPDGPFGEYTGYLGPQVIAPLCRVTCLTRRRDALYHDYGSGLTDMLVPDNMVMEGKLFAMVHAVAPSLVAVHVPASGRRFHAYLQFSKPAPGEVRAALLAALAYRRVKTVIAVDDDLDIFHPDDVLWALATRVQWDRDTITANGLSGSMLDPSLPEGARTTSKMAIDATLPPADGAGPPPFPPRSRVPDAAAARAKKKIAELMNTDWPST